MNFENHAPVLCSKQNLNETKQRRIMTVIAKYTKPICTFNNDYLFE